VPINVVAFDLGDTLVEYEGLPLSWEAHYPDALTKLAHFLAIAPTPKQITRACAVLRRFNTRLNPRTQEVPFSAILDELLPCFGHTAVVEEMGAATAFFAVFRQRLRCFPDSRTTLEGLRNDGSKIAVFTDVPYGMPRELVLEDIREACLTDLFDVFLTSRDVGWRKPSPVTLKSVADQLGCNAEAMTYIGNERKDIDAALAFGCRSILLARQGSPTDWGQHRSISSLTELRAVPRT
jgi:putative hydrolase of the HAD superfamily